MIFTRVACETTQKNGFGGLPQKSLDTHGLKPNGGLYVLYTVTFKKLYFTHTIRTVRVYLPTGIN